MLIHDIRDCIKDRMGVQTDNDISIHGPLGGGRSGAEVYRFEIFNTRGYNGKYVAKYIPSSQSGNDEETHFNSLEAVAGTFENHLVKLHSPVQCGDGLLLLYEQANQSVRNTIPFSDLHPDRMEPYAKKVSYDLLHSLNAQRAESVSTNPTDFLRECLSKQIDGRLFTRMENLLEEPEKIWFRIDELEKKTWPNPYYFLRHPEIWGKKLPWHFRRGIVHGDLHGENLLVTDGGYLPDNTDTFSPEYALIDYGDVSMNAFLLLDHAYLECSVFCDKMKDYDLLRWERVLNGIIRPPFFQDATSFEGYSECKIRQGVCAGIEKWMRKEGLRGDKDDLELQFTMARIVAGVNFLCKRTCTNRGKQRMLLLYIAYCLAQVLDMVQYRREARPRDTTVLRDEKERLSNGALWEDFLCLKDQAVFVLLTDGMDFPTGKDLRHLCRLKWSMVVDIGEEGTSADICDLFRSADTGGASKKVIMALEEKPDNASETLNLISMRKKADIKYSQLWRSPDSKRLMGSLRTLISRHSQVPVILVLDCGYKASRFRDLMIQNVLYTLPLPGGSRFVALRTRFTDTLWDDIPDLEEERFWHFPEHADASMRHVADACRDYLDAAQREPMTALIPSQGGQREKFTRKDLDWFSTTVEVVYDGMQDDWGQETASFPEFTGGDDQGLNFYMGHEATWSDIANGRDILPMNKEEYEAVKEQLSQYDQERSTHIRSVFLSHGPGAGGTTLSKRILWDMKEQLPCVRLKEYTEHTADILVEIGNRTGRRILLCLEAGSSVISEEDLSNLELKVDASNVRMLILKVERKEELRHERRGRRDSPERTLQIRLYSDLSRTIADNFYSLFSRFARFKPDGSRRENAEYQKRDDRLKNITTLSESAYQNQRNPFFYGFYAFQEEYHLHSAIEQAVLNSSSEEQELLNAMAFVTRFSQNLVITFPEMLSILKHRGTRDERMPDNYVVLKEKHGADLFRFVSFRNRGKKNEGCRICHETIAENLLIRLNGNEVIPPDSGETGLKAVVLPAAMRYIKTMRDIYSDEDEYANAALKELMIDRAQIDVLDDEAGKTWFSPLVELLELWDEREELFLCLIENFGRNPHYYNHYARLLAYYTEGSREMRGSHEPDYVKAVEQARTAVEIANEENQNPAIHETNLGIIYKRRILNELKRERSLKKAGRLSSRFSDLIDVINEDGLYEKARESFESARKHIDQYDSFSFFPQIDMECRIIKAMLDHAEIDYGKSNIERFVKEEPRFEEWYHDHYSLARELLDEMKECVSEENKYYQKARESILEISYDFTETDVRNRLRRAVRDNSYGSGRAVIYSAYSRKGSWDSMEAETIRDAAKFFETTLRRSTDYAHRNADVISWFELYRRTDDFQASRAKRIISDYMEESVKRSYWLFLMEFLLLQNREGAASPQTVYERIGDLKRLAESQVENTARGHDVYVHRNANTYGCAIVPSNQVERDTDGEMLNLEEFTGRVLEVGSRTKGTILLDKLGLQVIFQPKRESVDDDDRPLLMFDRNDEGVRVKFHLMFSYSGLRGLSVRKITRT